MNSAIRASSYSILRAAIEDAESQSEIVDVGYAGIARWMLQQIVALSK